ncbi:hypothetical protein LPTSP4_32620 [Leptospira ryugenii]|uniref:Uncharacterized protein n=1 Tax=Leptospira ryugenii TaxID=1917863 RepID=A0A2P2E4F0_9LEPT|nr:hypothetical protein [Leptospira ryugenii]GBF51724.1 hypothetical protein LPTSP4_32620 [Leptospira ryugenii]
MFLVPSPYHYDLYEEFVQEKKIYHFWKILLYGSGWFCFLFYIVLVFGYHVREAKFFLLDVLGLLLRFSGIVLFKQFEIPKILLYCLDKDPYLHRSAWKTFRKHREEILFHFFTLWKGKFFQRELLQITEEELTIRLTQLTQRRYNWKRISLFYFSSLSLLIIYILKILLG